MSREEKDMTGVLFVNDRKESDKHPDWSGKGMVDGKPVWISAWKKDGSKGKYMSLAFKPRDGEGKPRERKPTQDDDIPW